MLVEPDDTVILLPAKTRYEIPGGVTETSTERRVIFSPEIPGPRVEEARSEWEVFLEIARRVRPHAGGHLPFRGTQTIREESARMIPTYGGLQDFKKQGDTFASVRPMLSPGRKFFSPGRETH